MTPSHTYTLESADSFTDSALFCDFFTESCKIRVLSLVFLLIMPNLAE